jgi:hypothetical protein
MRSLLPLAAVAVILGMSPASAMCGSMGQQAQASTSAQAGMMCARPADDPMADKPAQPQQTAMPMCPCCRNMAMMRGGMMQGDDPHKGMDMPKQ